MQQDRINEALIEEPQEVPKSSWVLVGQFFIVPVIIVGLCVGVFLLFGLITRDGRTARDYLNEVRAGKANRWQAAFELSKHLTANRGAEADPRLARDVAAAFRGAGNDDPRIRQYLALAMGYLQDPVAVEPLIEALTDSDVDVRLYAAWSLGELRDPRAVGPLLGMLESSDPTLRKMAIFSLGLLQDQRSQPALEAALNDHHPDIRWNAALALARLGEGTGLPVLHQMLDRTYLDSISGLSADQKNEAMINAARGIALLRDATAKPVLEQVGKSDENVRVRSAALEALKKLP